MTAYSFSVGLLDASPNPNALQLWQSGTLTLDDTDPAAITGVLTLPGFYGEPIPYRGATVSSDTMAGQFATGGGQSAEAEITLNLDYRYDGFLYAGSYVGGLVSILDFNAQETYLYVVQGFSADGPFGAEFRGEEGAPDKR